MSFLALYGNSYLDGHKKARCEPCFVQATYAVVKESLLL